MSLFGEGKFSSFKEPVIFSTNGVEFTVPAIVLDYNALSTSVGQTHGVEAEGWTVVVDRPEWPLADPPKFGETVKAAGRILKIQFVQDGRQQITATCSCNMRAGAKS